MITIKNNEISSIFEGGGWTITKDKATNSWLLFEIPQYGGEQRLEGTYHNHDLDMAIKDAKRLT